MSDYLAPKECPCCGGMFQQRTLWMRYCSNRCRLRAWAKANRPRKTAPKEAA